MLATGSPPFDLAGSVVWRAGVRGTAMGFFLCAQKASNQVESISFCTNTGNGSQRKT
jgi:hypothetical protein